MRWRPLREGETDHELIWFFVSVGSFLVFIGWFWLGLPWPTCRFHEWTGLACPTCGMTRCARLLLAGDPGAAFAMNPLAFVSYLGVAVYDLYAGTVLALKLPRLRFDSIPPGVGRWVRYGVVAVLLLNWGWLIARGV